MFVGFVGLGAMGSAMASRLVGAGHRVRVWNRSADKVKPLVGLGAEAAGSLAAIAEAEVVISMLADDEAVRGTFVRDGLLAMMPPGRVHVNMASVSVDLVRQLEPLHGERGVIYIACPVMGRPEAAAAGKLNLLAAGPLEVIERLQPLFDVLGVKTWHFGEKPEQANVVKIGTNLTLACAIEAMSEASQLVKGYGLEAGPFLEMLASTLFAAPAYKLYGSLIAEERFSPAGFKVKLGLKDVRLALQAGDGVNTPLPFASVLRDNLLEAVANGDADLDWSALARVAQRRAGG